MLIFPTIYIFSKHGMHICTLSICFCFFVHSYSSVTNRNHSRNATGESVFFVCKESWKSICNEIQQLKRRSDNKRKECTQNWQYFILNDVQRSMNLSNKKPQKYVLSKHVDIFIDYFSLH